MAVADCGRLADRQSISNQTAARPLFKAEGSPFFIESLVEGCDAGVRIEPAVLIPPRVVFCG